LKVPPREVVTDAAPVYPAVLDELLPSAWHHVEQYVNNPIEADHSQLKRRVRPMRAADRSNRAGGHRWARLRPEFAPWLLRRRCPG
jgi:transposase-like protein